MNCEENLDFLLLTQLTFLAFYHRVSTTCMQHYLLNIKSMILNVTGQSGWGFFAAVVISFIILAPKSKLKDGYYDIFCVGFILISIAACFARGDSLRADLYDSGNRVMLQMVPFVVYAISYRYINLIEG